MAATSRSPWSATLTALLAAAGAAPAQVPDEVAAALEQQAGALFALLASAPERGLGEDDLVALVGTGSACGDLLPAPGSGSEVEAGGFLLRRAEVPAAGPAHRGRQALAAELGRLAASFRPQGSAPSPPALDVEVSAIERARDGWVAELAYTARAGPLEQSARWATRWHTAPRPEQPPLLVYAELARFETAERRAREAPFRDAAAEALGQQPAWRDDLALSFDRATAGLQRELRPGWDGRCGLAVGDADGDGREDLFVCQPGGLPNRVFLQQPDGGALESAAALRLDLLDATAAALLLDLDGDGDPDLVAATAGMLLVHENRDFQGQTRFGLRAALPIEGASSLAAADCDGDGDLDLFAAGADAAFDRERFPEPFARARNGRPSHLFRSFLAEGRFEFVDVTLESGLGALRGFTSAAAFEDCDRDGDPDLLVADACGPLRLFANEGGRFRDGTAAAGLEGFAHVQSLCFADVDRDGIEELCLAGARGLVLLERDAAGRFSPAGRLEAAWVFGATALDLQNDGFPDLVAIGGLASGAGDQAPLDRAFQGELSGAAQGGASYRAAFGALIEQLRAGAPLGGGQRARAWLNAGAGPDPLEARFLRAEGPLGLDAADDGRALAALDWNRDGAPDLVWTARSAPRLRLWLNRGAGGERAVQLRLLDRGPNRDAIGARVELETSQGPCALTLRAGGGFLAQSSQWLHAALPGDGAVRAAAVTWPDGTREPFAGLAPGRWTLTRGSGRAASAPAPREPAALAAPASSREDGPGARPAQGPGRALLLAAPVPLPPLPVMARDTARFSLSEKHPRARLVLLPCADAREARARLTAARPELERLGLELYALTDGNQILQPDSWPLELAPAFILVDAGPLRLLQLMADLCCETPPRAPAPCAVLIDPAGRLRAVYLDVLEPADVTAHARLLDASPEVLRDAAVPFPGRWQAPPPRADLAWIAARLREAGCRDAAAELDVLDYEGRELSRESMLTETALVRLRQGGPEEAVRHLRAALELAPDWPPALTRLGRALRLLARPAEAVPGLERALWARPRDPLAQAELARCFAALGLHGVADDLAAGLAAGDAAAGAALARELAGLRAGAGPQAQPAAAAREGER